MEKRINEIAYRFSVIANIFLFDELLTSPRRIVSNGYSPRLLFIKEYDIFKFYDRLLGKFTIDNINEDDLQTLNAFFETNKKIELGIYSEIVIKILDSHLSVEEVKKKNFLILHGKQIMGVGSITSDG